MDENYPKEEFTGILDSTNIEKLLLLGGIFKYGIEKEKKKLFLPRPLQNIIFNLGLNDMTDLRDALIIEKTLNSFKI